MPVMAWLLYRLLKFIVIDKFYVTDIYYAISLGYLNEQRWDHLYLFDM